MRPTLRQMEYVVAVHQLGKFGLAAEALNVSQPSLSNQVAAIENDLGVQLFTRGRGGIEATEKGLEFVQRARHVLAEVKNLRSSMMSTLPFGGRLRLGVLPSIGPYLLPHVMMSMHREQPDLHVVVREESTLNLDEGIRNGRFDAIISVSEDHPNARQCRLFIEPLWVAVPVGHAFASLERIGETDLEGQRLLTLDMGHQLSRIVYGLAGRSGGILLDDYEGTNLDSIVLRAALGAGIAVLPDLFARCQAIRSEEIIIRPLEMDGAQRTISVLFPTDQPFDNCGDRLTAALKEASKLLNLAVVDP